LVLPNIAALSDKQCQQLRQYVEGGGSLIATLETSLYNEWGKRRDNFGLADLFGATYTGKVEGPMNNSYLNLEKDPQTGQYHPLLRGFEDATRIINGVYRVMVTPVSDGRTLPSPLTVVPSYPDLPMESVWEPITNIKDPGVFIRQVGKGRVIYFPWDLDRTFWNVLDVDHSKLIRNSVLWSCRTPQPLSVEGPGMLDVSIWSQQSSMTVHLVNLTNPMMMKGPIREIIPVGPQKVRIRLSDDQRIRRAHLLVAKQVLPYRIEGEFLVADVPSIGLHEVIALDY
jgi:hypothetical protein